MTSLRAVVQAVSERALFALQPRHMLRALSGHRGWGDRTPRFGANRFGGGPPRADFPNRGRWAGVDDFGTVGTRRPIASYRDLDAPQEEVI